MEEILKIQICSIKDNVTYIFNIGDDFNNKVTTNIRCEDEKIKFYNNDDYLGFIKIMDHCIIKGLH